MQATLYANVMTVSDQRVSEGLKATTTCTCSQLPCFAVCGHIGTAVNLVLSLQLTWGVWTMPTSLVRLAGRHIKRAVCLCHCVVCLSLSACTELAGLQLIPRSWAASVFAQ